MKKSRRKFDKTKYILAFFITLIVFTLGLFVGDALNSDKLTEIQELNENIRRNTLTMQTQFDLVSENPCALINDSVMLEELLDVSLKLEYMENQLGNDDQRVLELKDYYSTLLIKQWLFTKKMQEQCPDNNVEQILYFYSTKEECEYCESQGFILTNLRKDYPNVRVFAFDYRLNNMALKTLRNMFVAEVDRLPVLVINGEVREGFMSRETLETELGIVAE